MSALQFECVKVALKQDRTGFILTVSVHPDEIPEELFRDFVGVRYGVAMVRIQDDESPTPYFNRVKKAGMLCRNQTFHRWLDYLCYTGIYENGESYEQMAINHVHEVCDISSRTELNGNKVAQQKFDEMVEKYERWKEESDPF
jgi:hypothetical protein